MKQLTYVKDGVQYFATTGKFTKDDNFNNIIKVSKGGQITTYYQDINSKIDLLFNTYCKKYVDVEKFDCNQWAMSSHNDKLCAVFAYCQNSELQNKKLEQSSFQNGKIPI